MKKRVIQYMLLVAILAGLPLASVWLSGKKELLEGLLAFPPRTEDWGLNYSQLWNVRCPFS